MSRLGRLYRGNPVLVNTILVALIAVLQSPGTAKSAVLAVLVTISGVLSRAQVTPVIDGSAKVVAPSGRVYAIPDGGATLAN